MRLGSALGGTVKKVKEKLSSDDKLWRFVKEKVDLGLELRRPYERRWLLDLAFLAGRQYVFFNTSAHLLQALRTPRGKKRYVDNQLLPRWRRQVSDMIATSPIMSVVPSSTEDDDIKAAKLGDKVLKAFWAGAKMKKKVRSMAGWIFSTGNVFLDDRWNQKLGPTELDEATGKLVFAGDADCGIWSPFEVVVPFVTLGDSELHRFPWIAKIKFRGLDWIAMNSTNGDKVTAEPIPKNQVDLNAISGFMAGSSSTKLPGAYVIDFYMQPNKEHPKGLFVSAANGVILERDDWPIDHYHIEHFKCIDVPGVFWGKCDLEEAVPLQITWNKAITSINEFNDVVAKGKGLAPRGSRLDAFPDDTHGEWIEYTPVLGHKPEYMTHKGLPQTLLWSLETTAKSLDNLFSQHESSRGTNKSDLRSGEMARFLREQDARGSVPTHAVFEESMEAVMSRVLKRIQQGYDTERMLKIEGGEGEFEVFAFKGADLRNNTDVSVKKDSSLPDSRLAREMRVLDNYEKGLYGDPRDPKVRRRVLNMMEDAESKDVFNELRLDESCARWENQLLIAGKEILINAYDNHAVHLEELNKFRKTLEYQKLKMQDPTMFAEREIAFDAHAQFHQQQLAAQEEAMMRRQAEFERMKKGGESGEAET